MTSFINWARRRASEMFSGGKEEEGRRREAVTEEMKQGVQVERKKMPKGYRPAVDRRVFAQEEKLKKAEADARSFFNDAYRKISTSSIIEGYILKEYIAADIKKFYDENEFMRKDTDRVKEIVVRERMRFVKRNKHSLYEGEKELDLMNDFSLGVERAMRQNMEERQVGKLKQDIRKVA